LKSHIPDYKSQTSSKHQFSLTKTPSPFPSPLWGEGGVGETPVIGIYLGFGACYLVLKRRGRYEGV
jgi:hypothetical protein